MSTLNPNDFNWELDKSGLRLSFSLSGMQLGCVNGMASPSVACCEASSKYFDVFWGFVAIGCVSSEGNVALNESESGFSCTATAFIWESSEMGRIAGGYERLLGDKALLGLAKGSGCGGSLAMGDSSLSDGSVGS